MKKIGLALGLAVAAVVLLVASIALVSLKTGFEAFEEKAQNVAEGLAAGLQQSIGADLLKVDAALLGVRSRVDISESGLLRNPQAVNSLVAEQTAILPDVDGFVIANMHGNVVLGAAASQKQQGIARADFFQLVKDESGDDMRIFGPVNTGSQGQWVLVLARKLVLADGAFAGVAFASVSTEHFQRILAASEVGERGAATLRTASMHLIARHVPGQTDSGAVGGSKVSEQLLEAVRASPLRGAFIARTALDSVERVSAYRQVAGLPLLVLVGIDRASYFAPWRQQAMLVMGMLATVLMALTGASVLVYFAWKIKNKHAQALAREVRRNHGLLLTASDGIHVLSRDGTVVEFSDLFAGMLGYERQELVGRHVTSWDASLDAPTIDQWLRTFQIGERRKFVTRHRRADGVLIDVEIHCAGVLIDSQELIFCSARDITERLTLERKLGDSAQELQDLYDNAPCGYHSVDADGVFVHVNATELAWLGYAREEVIGRMRAVDLLAGEARDTFEDSFARLKEGGLEEEIELDLTGRNGRRRRMTFRSSAIWDASGAFLRTRTVVFDITELYLAKEHLSRLSREQEVMLDNEMIGIARIRGRRIVWKNPAMDRIFGYPPGDLLGMSTQALYLDEESYRSVGEAAYPLIHRGGYYRRQLEMRRGDGGKVWIDANGALISNESGESLWMFADINAIVMAHARVEHIAFHDALTGLPNRLLLKDRILQGMAHADRKRCHLAVCYLDLDGFKKVNDEFGHAAGDILLKDIAHRLEACVRVNDTVSRLGGDEFVVLLSELDDPQEAVAGLIRMSAAIARPVVVGPRAQASVSASFGVSFYPEDATDVESLLKLADAAMYEAKRAGRNKYLFHGGEDRSMRRPLELA